MKYGSFKSNLITFDCNVLIFIRLYRRFIFQIGVAPVASQTCFSTNNDMFVFVDSMRYVFLRVANQKGHA